MQNLYAKEFSKEAYCPHTAERVVTGGPTADNEEVLKQSVKPGDPISYPLPRWEREIYPQYRGYAHAKVVRFYPHQVEVECYGMVDKRRTITYAEILTDGRILKKKGESKK